MGILTYRTTGMAIDVVKALLGLEISTSGRENIRDRPTLFVANHFTRTETFLVPYVIFQASRQPVRSLATHYLFKGLFGRYVRAIGAMSTRDPRRNRTIIRELMTGEFHWVIYPEGGLIKNKKTVHKGKLHLDHPDRTGPPHSGAAMLALKAEASKSRYIEACSEDDLRRIEFYEQAFGLTDVAEIDRRGIVITPVTLTFYPMRPNRNLINRLANLFVRDLDPRLDEELLFEGSLLLAGTEINVHFGESIEVADYLGRMTGLVRRVAGVFSEEHGTELFLRQQARRLIERCVRSIYDNLEINIDHVVSYGLRTIEEPTIHREDLRRALYLAAVGLARDEGVRLHPTLRDDIADLVTGRPVPALDNILALAANQKTIAIAEDIISVDHDRLSRPHEFQSVRHENTLQVLGNELEPVEAAVKIIRRCFNLSPERLRRFTSQVLREEAITLFDEQYDESYVAETSKPRAIGEPFFMEQRKSPIGVLLVHGYLAAPEQVRPLAEMLHEGGCNVYAARLDGHGTAPHALTTLRWHQWMSNVRHGYGVLRQHSERIVVVGFSLGGVLALLLATGVGASMDGVVAINPPFKLRDRRAPLVGMLVWLNKMLRRLRFTRGHYMRSNDDTESPGINYQLDFLDGVRELRQVRDVCRERLNRIKLPTLFIQGINDPLVVPGATESAFRRLVTTDQSFERFDFNRHVIIRGEGRQVVFDCIEQFVSRVSNATEVAEKPPLSPDAADTAA